MAKILVIDDEEQNLFTVETILQADGHEVTTAVDGEEGMTKLKATGFDVVITDIIMPGKEGMETIMEIVKSHPDVKIVAMSGGGRLGNKDILEMAEKLGATTTLPKPFKVDQLRDRISACLD